MSKRKFHSHLLWIVQPLFSNSQSLCLSLSLFRSRSFTFKRLHYPNQFAWNISGAPELSYHLSSFSLWLRDVIFFLSLYRRLHLHCFCHFSLSFSSIICSILSIQFECLLFSEMHQRQFNETYFPFGHFQVKDNRKKLCRIFHSFYSSVSCATIFLSSFLICSIINSL